jgi:hypothetical protein
MLQQFVKKARRKGIQVVALTTESNVWIGERPAPGEPENRESGRLVALVDVDGMLLEATFSETDPEVKIADPKQLSEIQEVGILPAQMLAAVRGVKAPRCYLCARQHDIRPYGPKLKDSTRYSGFWTCNSSDEEDGNLDCQKRADRKFSQAQQNKALKAAAAGMLNTLPVDYDPEKRAIVAAHIEELQAFYDAH